MKIVLLALWPTFCQILKMKKEDEMLSAEVSQVSSAYEKIATDIAGSVENEKQPRLSEPAQIATIPAR